MTVIDRTSDQAASRFPLGLIPIAIYFAAIEYYVIDLMWPLWPIPASFLSDLDIILSGRDDTRIFLAMALWDLELDLTVALGAILLVVAALRWRAFRRLLIVWLALGLMYPPVRMMLDAESAWQWPTNASMLAVVVIACGGIAYAVRSRRLQAFFNR